MSELIRDTVFGHALRFVTGKKVLLYEEEKNPELWKKYVNQEKTDNMTLHGHPEPPSEEEKEKLDDDSSENRQPSAAGSVRSGSTVVSNSAQANKTSSTGKDAEKGHDHLVVDWWGPEDPENPRNWSNPKKFWVTFCICFLTFSIYIGSAIYTSGVMEIVTEFGVSQVAATLGLTLFVLGYGFGPMIWAPMSEIPQIGRNPVYIGTLAVFVALNTGAALPLNFGMLLAFRFLTGFVGSPSLATGGASIGDMYSPAKRTYGLAVWGVGAISGPTLGPLVSGFAVQAKGWRWAIWELMWLSGFTLILLIIFLPETSPTNILYRRARRLRKLTGNDKLITEGEIQSQQMTSKDIVLMSIVRPFTLSFLEPICFCLNLYIALIYGLLYIWFESFPIVFTGIYGFNLGLTGLSFIGILIGVAFVFPPFVWYNHKYIEPKFDENGEIAPEWRLPASFVGAFAIPICLFWFGWSARPDIHWIMPIIGSAWFTVGSFLLFNSVLNYLSDAYPENAASVLAGNDFFRSTFGAGFPLFASAMYEYLGVAWASSTLAFISIAFIPIPFVLFKYGKQIRLKSKNARHDL